MGVGLWALGVGHRALGVGLVVSQVQIGSLEKLDFGRVLRECFFQDFRFAANLLIRAVFLSFFKSVCRSGVLEAVGLRSMKSPRNPLPRPLPLLQREALQNRQLGEGCLRSDTVQQPLWDTTGWKSVEPMLKPTDF